MPTERINIVVSAQDKTRQAFSSANRGMGKLRTSINQHSTGIKIAAGAATAAIGVMANKSINDASNLEESINAVQVTFGDASDEILKFGETAAMASGLSKRAVNEAAVPIGAQLRNMGFAANEAASETINLTKRATDMASVFNEDVEDVLLAIQSGLRGQTEPLTRFGIDLTEAQIKAVALSEGIIEVDRKMTQSEKTTARLAALFQQTAKVEGDFANTSEGLANQQRILKAEFENVRSEIGDELMPIMRDNVLPFLKNQFVPFIREGVVPALGDFFTGIQVVADAWDSFTTTLSKGFIALDKADSAAKSFKEEHPILGGKFLDDLAAKIPGFAHGGMVPGRRGEPQLIMAHGGERVVPNNTINLGGITINNEADTDRFMRKLSDMLGGQVEANKLGVL